MSISTVSYALNGTRPVSAATRARIEEAMAELRYTPNVLARGLRGRRARIIALVFPGRGRGVDISGLGYILGASDHAQSVDYHLMLWITESAGRVTVVELADPVSVAGGKGFQSLRHVMAPAPRTAATSGRGTREVPKRPRQTARSGYSSKPSAASPGGEPMTDPLANVERFVDDWQRNAEEKAARYASMRQEVERISITASAAGGAVSVTVGANGIPAAVTMTADVSRLRPEQIAAAVMEAMGKAQAGYPAELARIVGETVGETESGRHIVAVAERNFPQVEPDAPPAAPPRRQGDDGDFTDDSYLG